jgi:hypothetical protein
LPDELRLIQTHCDDDCDRISLPDPSRGRKILEQPDIGCGDHPEPEPTQESKMIAIARGSITEPDKLGPFIDDEMRVVEQLKAEGVMKALYRRAAGPGVVIVLEGASMDAIREQMSTLPFVREGLMTLEYEEFYEI